MAAPTPHLPTPIGIDLPSSALRLTAMAAAIQVDKTTSELETLLSDRRAYLLVNDKPELFHIPEPVAYDPAGPVWNRDFVLWSWRMGCNLDGVNGVRVIGYTGIAYMLDQKEQTIRRRKWNPNQPPARRIPLPLFRVLSGSRWVLLFDYLAIHQWIRQTDKKIVVPV